MSTSREYQSLSVDRLLVGNRAIYAIQTEDGRELLPAGSEITAALLEGLTAKGIASVRIHWEDRVHWGLETALRARSVGNDQVKVYPIFLDPVDVPPASKELRQFVEQYLRADHPKRPVDRRREFRCVVAIPVLTLPLNDRFEPVSTPFESVLRDISTSGAALLHTDPFTLKHVLFQVDVPRGKPIQLVMEVLRCERIDRFFDIAGKLLARLT